jgi:hypothetical protein
LGGPCRRCSSQRLIGSSSDRLADTGAMPKRPSPSQPEAPQTTCTIYKFASRLQWLGTVQATDKRDAIEKAAKEFRLDPAKLMAERQR